MIKRLVPKSEFARNVLTLMTGTTIAQAIPIALSPIITRLYSPEDFGIFALYFSIVSLISVVATARYEIAIVLPKKDNDAINLLALSIFITLFIALLISMLLFLFKDSILSLFNTQSIGNIIYWIPSSILLVGLYNSFNYWSNRHKRFKDISKSRILQAFGTGLSQISFGNFLLYGGMIFGNLIGSILSLALLLKKFIYNKDYTLINRITRKSIKTQAIKYKDFPLINSIHVFSDVAKTSLSTMMIASFFGSTVLGFYALSFRVLQTPLGIIGSSFGQVLYQKFNYAYQNNESLFNIVKSVLIKLIIVALPIFGILYMIAPELFAFVFGEQWRVVGIYTQILLPYLFVSFLLSPISQIPIILGKQKQFFYIAIIGNIAMPLIIYIGYLMHYGFKSILFYISYFFLLYLGLIIIWILNLSYEKGKKCI